MSKSKSAPKRSANRSRSLSSRVYFHGQKEARALLDPLMPRLEEIQAELNSLVRQAGIRREAWISFSFNEKDGRGLVRCG